MFRLSRVWRTLPGRGSHRPPPTQRRWMDEITNDDFRKKQRMFFWLDDLQISETVTPPVGNERSSAQCFPSLTPKRPQTSISAFLVFPLNPVSCSSPTWCLQNADSSSAVGLFLDHDIIRDSFLHHTCVCVYVIFLLLTLRNTT